MNVTANYFLYFPRYANCTLRFYNRIHITEILCNHLNLPTSIYFGNGGAIEYIYNAAGQKVKKTVYDTPNNTIKQVDYLDGFQYAGDILQFFPTTEGYVSATPTSNSLSGSIDGYLYNYVYNYTDHLGNIRVSYTKDPVSNELKVMEENNYYPFGLKHAVYNSSIKHRYQLVENMPEGQEVARPTYVLNTDYMYKYNGKEFQDELGLGWYDYHARNYDPALGRWMNVDPLAEVSRKFSPYVYALNNPVFFIDPDGMMAEPPPDFNGDSFTDDSGTYTKTGEYTYTQEGSDGITFEGYRTDAVQLDQAEVTGSVESSNSSSYAYKGSNPCTTGCHTGPGAGSGGGFNWNFNLRGNSPQTFPSFFTTGPGRTERFPDPPWLRPDDVVRMINFDDFIKPGGTGMGTSFMEAVGYTISAWGVGEGAGGALNDLGVNSDATVPMQFDSVFPTPNGHAVGRTPIHNIPIKDTASEMQRRQKINSSVIKNNPIKSPW